MEKAKISDIVNNNVKIISKNITFKKQFFGDSPAPFIGRFDYPNVNVGVLSSTEQTTQDPKEWSAKNVELRNIVGERSSLLNSRTKSSVKSIGRINEMAKEVGLSSKNVEVELELKEIPKFRLKTDYHEAPRGPTADFLKGKVTGNVKVPTRVEKVHSDNYLKATEGMYSLYKKGISENHLSKILSVGAVGMTKDRKMVPTRWSITAVDDSLGKELIEEVKKFKLVENYELYFGGYLGNYYLILVLPEEWGYELFEYSLSMPDKYSTDFERYNGRKTYSDACTGGYYTVRLAILEHLKEVKKQGKVIAFRFITPKYEAPLGVWVTREATRKAFLKKEWKFESKEDLLKTAKERIWDNFRFDLDNLSSKSVLLNDKQTRLFSFV